MNSWVVRSWVFVALLAGGCSGGQAALRPAGPQAQHIRSLSVLFIIVTTFVYLASVGAILVGVWRRHRLAPEQPEPPVIAPDPLREKRYGIVVGALVGITTIILFIFMISDFVTGR